MISRIYVDNYRTLVRFELALGREHIFLGRNGSGKTTVFDAVDAVVRFARGDVSIDDAFPQHSLTRWEGRNEQAFELDIAIAGDERARYRLLIEHDRKNDRRRVIEETVWQGKAVLFQCRNGEAELHRDDGSMGAKVLVDWSRSSLPSIHVRDDNRKLTGFKNRLARVRVARPDPRAMSAWSEGEVSAPDRSLTNLVSWYRHLVSEDFERVAKMTERLKSIVGGLIAMNVKSEGGSRKLMTTRWRGGATKDAKPIDYSFDELSDGQRVLIGLAMLAEEPGEGGLSLLLDEPDNFVALDEIQPLLMTMREKSNLQLIVVSHHPEVINLMARDHGVVFERRSYEPTVSKPFNADEDEELTPAELVARGEL